MAKKELKKKKKNPVQLKLKEIEKGPILTLKDETKHGILSILFFVFAIFLALSKYEMAGEAGGLTYRILGNLFGTGYLLFPVISLLIGISFLRAIRPKIVSVTLTGGALFLVSTLGITDIVFRDRTLGEITGGSIGKISALPFLKLFDSTLSIILLGAIATISTLIIFESRITVEPFLFGKRLWGASDEDEIEEDEDEAINEAVKMSEKDTEDEKKQAEKIKNGKTETATKVEKKKTIGDKIENFLESSFVSARPAGKFTPPPLSIFENDSGKPSVGDIKANANIIKRTLFNFGIDVEMDEISIGPSITRYAFKPAEGVKLSRIIALQNDLALALAAHPIRIEAPIPGKSLVGIEIPNKIKSIVGLGSLFATKQFQESLHPLYVALGRGVSGIPYYTNLAKAPHMLIAGTTGSGKSVTIHEIIASLLYRNPPDKLRFIMIDPKRVELTLYKGIQHLLTEVITDPKKAILSLKWATKEMERRYNILETATVKDIQSYHKMIAPIVKEAESKIKEDDDEARDELPEAMPYIVIIIDELADIMSAYPRELESAIVRLAQMSRAVGIHLILSTQRPSTEVITGLIKANIPTRVALQVPSQIDSRTIIDVPGAERLLGAGDMLFIGNETSKAIRIQSGFITEGEVKRLAKHIKDTHQDELPSEINMAEVKDNDTLASMDFTEGNDSNNDDEGIYNEAKKIVMMSGKASSSLLQRKLRLGYARAARIMDLLEERGVIGPGEGSKTREVYMRSGDGNGGGAVAQLEREYENRNAEMMETESVNMSIDDTIKEAEELETGGNPEEGPYNESNKEF